MKVQRQTKQFVECPICHEHEWRVDQCVGHTEFGPWSCPVCNNYFRFIQLPSLAGDTFEVEQVDGPNGRQTPVTVTLRSTTTPPITLKLNTWKYGHSQKDTPEEYRENQRYFYNDHTCPTNWFRDVDYIEFEGDTDPHGVFEFISVEDGHFEDE